MPDENVDQPTLPFDNEDGELVASKPGGKFNDQPNEEASGE
jgi:hypothetical protein